MAKRSGDADQTRRLMSLPVVYAGGSRGEGAKAGGVGLQTFRDWVLRFNAAGLAGLLNGKAPGQAPRLDATQQRELAQMIEDGPIPAFHGVVRWRLCDLVRFVSLVPLLSRPDMNTRAATIAAFQYNKHQAFYARCGELLSLPECARAPITGQVRSQVPRLHRSELTGAPFDLATPHRLRRTGTIVMASWHSSGQIEPLVGPPGT